MVKFNYLAFATLLAICVSGANAQDFDKGLAAYKAGNFKAAFKEFFPLAKSGDAHVQDIIGWMYENGMSVVKSDTEAVKWYKLGAYQGDAHAQSNVGQMYEHGNGVMQNSVIAHMWYNIASANGMIFAAEWRNKIADKMTREDISKAQAMAQVCMSSNYQNCGD